MLGRLHERAVVEGAEGLATAPAGRDEPGRAQPAEVPAHERLREPDMADEVRDARRPGREALDDPQAVDVRERTVEQADAPQVVRLVDDRGDRGTDAGAAGRMSLRRINVC